MEDGKFKHNVTAASTKTKVFDLFSLKGRTALSPVRELVSAWESLTRMPRLAPT